MLWGDCRRWKAASAGRSDGRIGRMCTVSPSPRTTSLAHRSSGLAAGFTVSGVLLELDLDDGGARPVLAAPGSACGRRTAPAPGRASLPSWSRIVATSVGPPTLLATIRPASNELARPVHVTNGRSTATRSAETVTPHCSSIGPASQCVDAVRPRRRPPAASRADPVELASTQRGRTRRIHVAISGCRWLPRPPGTTTTSADVTSSNVAVTCCAPLVRPRRRWHRRR